MILPKEILNYRFLHMEAAVTHKKKEWYEDSEKLTRHEESGNT